MKFLTLEVKNFGAVSNITINLANQGLVLIVGRNEDSPKATSNGSGKSLLLEAFCWCLWGKTIRGLRGDSVINRRVGKNCAVTTIFEEGEHTYKVCRSRKPTGLHIFRTSHGSSGNLDITGPSIASTQEYLTELVGMDFDLFCAMMPGAGLKAAEMTDKEVKSLLERLLQTEVLGKACDKVKEQLKAVAYSYTIKSEARIVLDASISECNNRLEELKEKFDYFDTSKEEAVLSIQTQVGAILSKLEDQDKILESSKRNQNKQQSANKKLLSIIEDLEFANNNIEVIRSTSASRRSQLQIEEGVLEQEEQRIQAGIGNLPNKGRCSVCYQTTTKEHIQEICASFRKDLQEVFCKQETLKQEIDKNNSDCYIATKSLEDLVAATEAKKQLTEKDIQAFSCWKVQRATAAAVKEQLMELMSSLSKQQHTIIEEKNPFQGLMDQTVHEGAKKVAEASRLASDIVKLKHKRAILDYWYTGFSPHGIRSFMLEHVTPFLNQAAAKYSDLLTAGEMSVTFHTQQQQKSGKVAEKFNIVVEQKHGGSSYTASSNGERSRANLVVAFAIGDLAALRTNKAVSFRFLDEPFENVDETGIEAIMLLLNDQKDRFDSVFVITHQDHFKQLFPKRMTVVKKNGMTMLEGACG